jgi:hypothetical protein
MMYTRKYWHSLWVDKAMEIIFGVFIALSIFLDAWSEVPTLVFMYFLFYYMHVRELNFLTLRNFDASKVPFNKTRFMEP